MTLASRRVDCEVLKIMRLIPNGVSMRTLAPKGVDCEISHWLERETKKEPFLKRV